MTVLLDFQHELGGVRIGGGAPGRVAAIEGLGMPPVRTADVEPPHGDGLWLGRDYYGGRTIRIDGGIRAVGDPGAVLDELSALQAAADDPGVRGVAGATMDLRLKFPGRPVRVVRGRLRKLDTDLSALVHGWVPIDVEFQAADYLFYGDEAESTSMPLGVIATGGMDFPFGFPLVFTGGTGPEGRPGWISVSGTAPTWPVLRVTGPCANPSITHVESAVTIGVAVTLGVGEWVEIDTRPGWRTVLLDTGAHAALTPGSRLDLFQLPPGSSEVRWYATDPTLTSTLSVQWWPAYKAL